RLAPHFAEIVRRDLPMTHRLFSSLGELKSVTFRDRGPRGDDAYNLVFANGEVIMSAALDAEGRMVGGIIQMAGSTAGTEAALRNFVPAFPTRRSSYLRLAPHFAEIVRRDLPMTH